jgi:hypothetical protein
MSTRAPKAFAFVRRAETTFPPTKEALALAGLSTMGIAFVGGVRETINEKTIKIDVPKIMAAVQGVKYACVHKESLFAVTTLQI